jgi:pimeloyl-ACP methyl ester carboxylesterase
VHSGRHRNAPDTGISRRQWNNRREAGDMGVAALVIHGDQDRVTAEEGARQLAEKANPQAAFIKIPNADHNDLSCTQGSWRAEAAI